MVDVGKTPTYYEQADNKEVLWMPLAYSEPVISAGDLDQLRHHTKNALASILAELSSGLALSDASRRVAIELERRITLTSQIADALFGLTHAPDPFPERLRALGEGLVALIGEGDQYLTLTCRVDGDVPVQSQGIVLRVAHEFIGNAIKHGMCMRLIGRIAISVTSQAGGTLVEISDDGWGCGCQPAFGDGLRAAAALAETQGGRVGLWRRGDQTTAQLLLPPVRHDA